MLQASQFLLVTKNFSLSGWKYLLLKLNNSITMPGINSMNKPQDAHVQVCE